MDPVIYEITDTLDLHTFNPKEVASHPDEVEDVRSSCSLNNGPPGSGGLVRRAPADSYAATDWRPTAPLTTASYAVGVKGTWAKSRAGLACQTTTRPS